MQADWNTPDPAEKGSAVVSWGHMYSYYSADWQITSGPGCDFSGCGIGFGFDLVPQDHEKETWNGYAFAYCYGRTDC